MRRLKERTAEMMSGEGLDDETTLMVERLAVLRIATKHVNLWIRQLEMKRRDCPSWLG